VKEEDEQWCYGEIINAQRTEAQTINGYYLREITLPNSYKR
jgi:hypothetical protein